ncbi:DUF1992 domain-containing protein [Gordonia soli]|uniref:DnaJ homologue subfamily C member 28 conserved domain-containing protein n=1 Tax=Gordonia soli NBRC 108243 TaxID=1223545 RepID=M0QMV2_9ACTN|nr:DUF1992 domain-containing protein [Gordonia soli]GAC68747.1 hypothetical protein GS4_18_00350 [Gordonia soli NBRC 108243]
MHRFESRVERLIREATARGDFDDLPGAGKPLDLSDSDDPDWWVKRKIRDENLGSSALLPPVLRLRKEADGFPESLRGLTGENAVRAVLEDYNRRVRYERLGSRGRGPTSNLVAPLVDVDAMITRWRELS